MQNRQSYKGFTLDKINSTPGDIIWEVIDQQGEILEGCSSLAYAKRYVRDYLVKADAESQAYFAKRTHEAFLKSAATQAATNYLAAVDEVAKASQALNAATQALQDAAKAHLAADQAVKAYGQV